MDNLHGFIHEKVDIKIFLLYLLNRLCAPVTLDQLYELTTSDGGMTYFDFAECVAELVSTGHVEEKDGLYSITEKGARNGEITETSLPVSVRARADADAEKLSAAQRRDSMIKTSSRPSKSGGFDVRLTLSDGSGVILDMTLLAGTEDQAAVMQKNFRSRAEEVYKSVVGVLLTPGKK
jgi:hypothetical protein